MHYRFIAKCIVSENALHVKLLPLKTYCLLIKTADLHHCFAIMVKEYHSYIILVVKSQRIAVRSTEHKVLSLVVLGWY